MPVETEEARTSDAGNGVTTVFDFPYRFLTDDMLLVYLSYIDGGTGENIQIEQILNTDYTVQGAGADEGGTVTFITPPPSGNTVTIIRDPDLKQETAYNDGDDFPALSTQDALDKATMQVQRLDDRQNRSFELPDTGVSGQSFYDVGGNRLANVGDGIDAQDAATVNQFDQWTGQVAGDADRAEAAADAAEGYRDETIGYRDETKVYRDETEGFRDEVTTLYLGAKAADPTVDNDGNPLIVGAYYFNTTNNTARTWNGAVWQDNADLVDALPISGGFMTGQIGLADYLPVASATTTDLGAQNSNLINITGTTTITSLGTAAAGTWRKVRFDGVLTLTHNATSMILRGNNIMTTSGDVIEFVSEGSGNWRMLNGSVAAGVVDGEVVNQVFGKYESYAAFTAVIPGDDTIPLNTEGAEFITLAITPKSTTNKLKFIAQGGIELASVGYATAAVFKDSDVSAIASDAKFAVTAFQDQLLQVKDVIIPATLNEVTLKLRLGVSTGTAYINGDNTSRLMGGTQAITFEIEEIKAS